jgi:hypothetical protein
MPHSAHTTAARMFLCVFGALRPGLLATFAMSSLALLATCACRSNPPAREEQLVVADLAAGIDDPDNDCVVLVTGSCGVRFPATLAIAELSAIAAKGGPETDAAKPASDSVSPAHPYANAPPDCGFQLRAVSPADQGRWVEAFRGVVSIRDLRFLSPVDLKCRGECLPALVSAAQRAGAGLLLTYAPNRCGPNSARSPGIIYGVQARQPVAKLQAQMQFLNDEGVECAVDDQPGDYREEDAVFQTAREFERRCVACICELARQTPTDTTLQPHRWIPLYPYCWQPLVRPQSAAPCAPAVPDPPPGRP